MKPSLAASKEAPLIDLESFKMWILHEDERLLVVNKPAGIVCHPSKNGPFSSLAGAVREYLRSDKVHLVSRLDRETSGLVLFAKDRGQASICQKAIENRQVTKIYQALLYGMFTEPVIVDKPLGQDRRSIVQMKQCVYEHGGGKSAKTYFKPLRTQSGFTWAEIEIETGRKHQIRAHAQWIGHWVVGDKLYGPNELLYLEFIERGWQEIEMRPLLFMDRQALHAASMVFHEESGFPAAFEAPIAPDMEYFWHTLAPK